MLRVQLSQDIVAPVRDPLGKMSGNRHLANIIEVRHPIGNIGGIKTRATEVKQVSAIGPAICRNLNNIGEVSISLTKNGTARRGVKGMIDIPWNPHCFSILRPFIDEHVVSEPVVVTIHRHGQ